MAIDLDAVPLRAKDMTPAEILSSESQERMCAVVAPENVDAFMAGLRANGRSLATVIGEVTDGDRLLITWHGETVVDVPPRTVAHEGPVYDRPSRARPARTRCSADTTGGSGAARGRATSCATTIARMRGQPAAVQPRVGHRPVRPLRARQHRARRSPPTRGVLRIDEATGRGIAVSTDCNAPVLRCWTPTPAPSSRWPRPTATSPSPAPPRSRSPTA